MAKNTIIADIRSGITRLLASQVFAYILPFVTGGLVVVAAFFQTLPWAYVTAAAFSTTAIVYGGVATGLNQLSVWRSRLLEHESLAIEGASFDVALHTEVNNKIGVCLVMHYRNKAKYKLKCAVKDVNFYLQKTDGTATRNCDPEFNRAVNIADAETPVRFSSGAVIFEDLVNEVSLKGRFSITMLFGRKEPQFPLVSNYDVIGTRQQDGSWKFRAENSYV